MHIHTLTHIHIQLLKPLLYILIRFSSKFCCSGGVHEIPSLLYVTDKKMPVNWHKERPVTERSPFSHPIARESTFQYGFCQASFSPPAAEQDDDNKLFSNDLLFVVLSRQGWRQWHFFLKKRNLLFLTLSLSTYISFYSNKSFFMGLAPSLKQKRESEKVR